MRAAPAVGSSTAALRRLHPPRLRQSARRWVRWPRRRMADRRRRGQLRRRRLRGALIAQQRCGRIERSAAQLPQRAVELVEEDEIPAHVAVDVDPSAEAVGLRQRQRRGDVGQRTLLQPSDGQSGVVHLIQPVVAVRQPVGGRPVIEVRNETRAIIVVSAVPRGAAQTAKRHLACTTAGGEQIGV